MTSWLQPDRLLPSALLMAGAAAVIYAALHDIVARTVPNTVPACLLVLGLAQRLLSHTLLPGLAWGLAIFVLATICWRRGWLGGGDVKLLPTGALMMPPMLCAEFLASVTLAGGVLALVYIVLAACARRRPLPPSSAIQRRRPVALWRRAIIAERWRLSRGVPLPYATAIAAGFLFTLFRT
jgi:prepilin peptidase CpaA